MAPEGPAIAQTAVHSGVGEVNSRELSETAEVTRVTGHPDAGELAVKMRGLTTSLDRFRQVMSLDNRAATELFSFVLQFEFRKSEFRIWLNSAI